jgi:hypothetical protein
VGILSECVQKQQVALRKTRQLLDVLIIALVQSRRNNPHTFSLSVQINTRSTPGLLLAFTPVTIVVVTEADRD